MEYGKAFLFFMQKPKTGYKNLLLATVTNLIPVIGPIVLIGYMVVVADWLLRDEKREHYPDFSFDRLVDYLKLGVWPFVTLLIFSAIIFIPCYIILIAAALGIGYGTNIPILIPIILALGGFILGTLVTMCIGPVFLYSQKVQKTDLKGALKFTIRFVKIIGIQYPISIIVYIFASTLVSLVGFLLCFVGLYPANTLTQFAYEHILIQMYDEYLKQGGIELPTVDLPKELVYDPNSIPKPNPLNPDQADYDDPEFR